MSAPDLDLGVYVHLPFCPHVCPYCDFAVLGVGTLGADREQRYVDSLLLELALLLERFGPELGSARLATLYLGGGTPSLCSPRGLARIVEGVCGSFGGDPEEITLEVNPGREETRRAPEWRSLGVTRLSVGVQALDDRSLRRLGRAHGAEEARARLARCLAAGFASLSVDLIYGVPDQPDDVLLAGVAEAIALEVPHVSTYALTLEPGTPFARASEQGRLHVPDDGRVRRQGRQVRALLAASGRAPYEISSAALAGHASRHNSRYWTRRPVLGLGVSAASLLGERRFQNPRDTMSWEATLARRELAIEAIEVLDVREQQRETLALGLRRLEGVVRRDYRRRFGEAPEVAFARELAELAELELVTTTTDRLHLTQRGVDFADEVFMRFVGR